MTTKAISPIEDVRNTLNLMQPEFKKALPSHINSERFTRSAMTVIQSNPRLLDCDRRSLFAELLKCANDGLIPDGAEASIIPYGNVAKYTPQIKGITKKARNSGEISSMDAIVVHEHDLYESWTDEKGPHFRHVKARKDRGEVILTYAYAITKDGGFYFEEIDEDEMKFIEKASKSKDSVWQGNFKNEMRRKATLKRLAKYRIPSSSDMESLLERDAELFHAAEEKNVTPAIESSEKQTPQIEAKPVAKPKSKIQQIVEAKSVTKQQTPTKEDEPRDEVGASELPL